MSNQQRGGMQPRQKTKADHPIYKMKGAVNSDGKRPTIQFYLHVNANDPSKNAPRCVVYTNSVNDKATKTDQVQGEMDIQIFNSIMDAINDAADPTKEFKQETIELLNFTWMGGQRSNEPMPKAYVIVARRDSGVVFISLKHFDKNRAAIPFDFGFSEFARLLGEGGNPDAVKESRRAARSMAKMWSDVVNKEYLERMELPQPKPQQGFGGNNGGFGGGNGGFGGGQNNFKQNNGFNQGGGFGGQQAQSNAPAAYDFDNDTLFGEPI